MISKLETIIGGRLSLLAVLLICQVAPCLAADMEITPFRTINQSPLVQIFGLPAESSATVTPSGLMTVSLTQDIASEYTVSRTASEQIVLDGESYRWTLAARYGLFDRFEVGVEIPYILYGGGFLDGFIVDWHSAFGLPQGGRDSAPRDRLSYRYSKNGVQKLRMEHAGSGIGDIVFSGGMNLYDDHDSTVHDSLALRSSIKVPTGDSGSLRGSGSTDFTLALCGGMNNFTEWGSLGLFGSVGGLALTRGDVLADQQNSLAGFGTLGLGWGPAEWISFKVQLNAHTALYHDSTLDELSKTALMLTGGGALKLPGDYLLDIGVSEDVAVSTAPDVAFHLGLSKRF
jgi:Protein of unknown function (DUF3187)